MAYGIISYFFAMYLGRAKSATAMIPDLFFFLLLRDSDCQDQRNGRSFLRLTFASASSASLTFFFSHSFPVLFHRGYVIMLIRSCQIEERCALSLRILGASDSCLAMSYDLSLCAVFSVVSRSTETAGTNEK